MPKRLSDHINQIVEHPESGAGRVFAVCIQILIVVSIITFSLETLPNLANWQKNTLWMIEVFLVAIFTAEYLIRVLFSNNGLRFAYSFFGIIDLLSILPFYLGLGFDLRSLRAFRLLRLVRILKLARYNAAIGRLHRAVLLAKEEIILFISVTMILLYLSAVGIYFFENEAQPDKFSSVFDAMWWSTVTLTTVGYGDVYPITVGGRIFTFCVLIVGLGIVALPTGIIASALSSVRNDGSLKEPEDGL